MAKKPKICSCVWADSNQVKRVIWLKCGQLTAISIRPDNRKATVPNLIWQKGPPLQAVAPQTVLTKIIATAMSGMINKIEAKVLVAGYPRGHGAPCGMPRNVPNKINVQNANCAQKRLCSGFAAEFRQEIKRDTEADEREPNEQQIIHEPPN